MKTLRGRVTLLASFKYSVPPDIYLFRVNNENIKTMGEICSNLGINGTSEQRQNYVIDVFLMFLLLILSRFFTLFRCFHCWLWKSKCQVGWLWWLLSVRVASCWEFYIALLKLCTTNWNESGSVSYQTNLCWGFPVSYNTYIKFKIWYRFVNNTDLNT